MTTSEEADWESANIHYATEAFDVDLGRRWAHEGTYRSQTIMRNDDAVFFNGTPWIWGFLSNDDAAVVTSAGRSVLILDMETGEALYDEKQAGTIVNVQAILSSIFIATSDGTTVSKFPFSEEGDYEGDASRMLLPNQIRWAGEEVIDGEAVVVGLSAVDESRIFAYRTNYAHSDDPYREYTLDELITLAHETLAEAGRESIAG